MRELKQDWRDVFQGFSVALAPRKIILGFGAVIVSMAVVTVLGLLFSWLRIIDTAPSSIWHALTSLLAGRSGPVCKMVSATAAIWEPGEVVLMVFGGLLIFYVWCVFGGAICRMAAADFARDEPVSMGEALRFARGKAGSYFWATLACGIGILILACLNALGGWVGQIPVLGPILVGLGFGLAIIAGFLAVILVIVGVFGLPLMFPAISAEGTDAFDAVSRAFSYVLQKPWRYIWYHLCACAYGAIVCAFVLAFAMGVKQFTMGSAVYVGMWEHHVLPVTGKNGMIVKDGIDDPIYENVANSLGPWSADTGLKAPAGARAFCAGMIELWLIVIVVGGVVGFGVSYLCSANTIIYFLMRKAVDGTDMTEIYLEDDEEDFAIPAPAPEPAPAPAPAVVEAPEPAPEAEDAPAPAAKKAKKKTKKRAKRKTAKKRTARKKKTT